MTWRLLFAIFWLPSKQFSTVHEYSPIETLGNDADLLKKKKRGNRGRSLVQAQRERSIIWPTWFLVQIVNPRWDEDEHSLAELSCCQWEVVLSYYQKEKLEVVLTVDWPSLTRKRQRSGRVRSRGVVATT
jgi:hypothetical protein